jgi:hypothetical protein
MQVHTLIDSLLGVSAVSSSTEGRALFSMDSEVFPGEGNVLLTNVEDANEGQKWVSLVR